MSLNLGQVAGLFVGTSAPTNTKLIWFDSTVSVKYHKVYNFDLNIWEKLNKSSISNKTYSELVTLATGSGLSLGAQYYITNLEVLAVAITNTKINYFDSSSNLIVDDLGSTKSYIVSASNLIIDDVQGVYDENAKKVVFSFQPDTFDGEDYAHAQGVRINVVKLLKYKWKSIISSKSNNSIVWDGGIYFNLKAALGYIFDKTGGVVSYETFVTSNTSLSNQLSALSNNYQNFASNASSTIQNELSSQKVYSKQIYNAPDVNSEATDISNGDSLYTIISKIQRYINKFKRADGMRVTESFVPSTSENLTIINTDTVDIALRKVQKKINEFEDLKDTINGGGFFKRITKPSYDLRFTRKNGKVIRVEGLVKLYFEDLVATGLDIEFLPSDLVDADLVSMEFFNDQGQSINNFFCTCHAYKYDTIDNTVIARNFLIKAEAYSNGGYNYINFSLVQDQNPPVDTETYGNYILICTDLFIK